MSTAWGLVVLWNELHNQNTKKNEIYVQKKEQDEEEKPLVKERKKDEKDLIETFKCPKKLCCLIL